MHPNKIILNSVSGYTPSQDALLTSILERGISLFCTVGKDCTRWEDAMDALCELRGGKALEMITTSHPGETPDDVLAFANQWPAIGAIQMLVV
jgi:hypothetical protein